VAVLVNPVILITHLLEVFLLFQILHQQGVEVELLKVLLLILEQMEDQEVELLIETHLHQTAQRLVEQEIHLPLVHLKDLMVEMQITLGVMLEAAVVVEQLLMD
tara:strand:- start:40 stop:351 length:312 start_codon:yes stop_codon:yes gene_type:complete